MATPIPELTEQQLDSLESKAEAKVYRALRDQLRADCRWEGIASREGSEK
ncbi:MAG: hypothetical protein ABTS22_15545 [Accumulibacter sp.]